MNVLLIGSSGQIGRALASRLGSVGHVICSSRSDIDLACGARIPSFIHDLRPNVIVNAAAYTKVEEAEANQDLAFRINGIGPGVLARTAGEIGALFVHFSTDYVFDGTADVPYEEDHATNPINAYGRSKLLGEEAITKEGGAFCILRTSWVYSAAGPSFLQTILRLAQEREEISVVADQIGSPTSS